MSSSHTCSKVTASSGQDGQKETEVQQVLRNIPINIETDNSHITFEPGENVKVPDQVNGVKIRNIPIEIIPCSAEQMGDVPDGRAVCSGSNARTIPIQRINKNNVRNTPPITRTPSRESLGSSTNKIKMGTSAIRIPIQVNVYIEYCILLGIVIND